MALALAVSLFVVGIINDLWSYEASRRALPFMLFAGLGFYLTTLICPEVFFLFIVYEGLALSFAFCAYLFLTVSGEAGAAFWSLIICI